MITRPIPISAVRRRRNALFAGLGSRAALFAAGTPRPRNYAANAFPFRPHSHFLYFFGWGASGAWALFDGGQATIFMRPPDVEDALWSGSTVTLEDLSRQLDVPVLPIDDLAARLRGRDVATLPAPDAETRITQAGLLGREIHADRMSDADLALADRVIALRLEHDDEAIAELKAAAEATVVAHRAGMQVTAPGLRESAVRAAMEAELTARDLITAYPSIVTVHGEVLHNESHHHVIEASDLLLADVGAESLGGFAADVTRTWPAARQFSTEAAEIYDVVLAAQEAAIAKVRPGVRYRDVHLVAMETLARGLVSVGVLRGDPGERARDGSVALFFPHGIGHLLGLDVHDMEDLGDRAGYAPGRTRSTEPGLRYLRLDRDLTPRMAVTIEPGIYFVPALLDDPETRRRFGDRVVFSTVDRLRPIRGIRIEDDVLVTADAPEVLTVAVPKTRAAVEALRAAAAA